MNPGWIFAAVLAVILVYLVLGNTRSWSRLRRIVRIRTISADEALTAAKAACAERGWPWEEPVVAQEEPTTFRFMTNTHYRGGNCFIVVAMSNGKIKRMNFAIR